MTLTKRHSKFKIIFKLPNYRANTCHYDLENILADYGAEHYKSITFDSGSEFTQLANITDSNIYSLIPIHRENIASANTSMA